MTTDVDPATVAASTAPTTAIAATAARDDAGGPWPYTLTRWDMLRLMWVHPLWAPMTIMILHLTRFGSGIVAPVAAAAGAGLMVFGIATDRGTLTFIAAVLLLFVPVLAFKALVIAHLRRQFAPRGYGAPHAIDMDDDALHYHCDGRHVAIPWRSIRRVNDLPHYFIVRVSFREDVLIPKRAFGGSSESRHFLWRVRTHAGNVVRTDQAVAHARRGGLSRGTKIGIFIMIGLPLSIFAVVILWDVLHIG